MPEASVLADVRRMGQALTAAVWQRHDRRVTAIRDDFSSVPERIALLDITAYERHRLVLKLGPEHRRNRSGAEFERNVVVNECPVD